MKSTLKKLAASDDRLTDLLTLICSGLPSRGKLFRSRKVHRRIEGKLTINGRLDFGLFSNRVGLDPGARGVLRIYKGGELRIDGHVRLAQSCQVFTAGQLSIGAGTYINPGTMIFCRTDISIGSGCAISWNCEIIDDDFHQLGREAIATDRAKPISIGDHVWIGSNCSVLKGVRIGDGSIIGTRSVVTRDIPPHCLAVGTPARVIKENIDWK